MSARVGFKIKSRAADFGDFLMKVIGQFVQICSTCGVDQDGSPQFTYSESDADGIRMFILTRLEKTHYVMGHFHVDKLSGVLHEHCTWSFIRKDGVWHAPFEGNGNGRTPFYLQSHTEKWADTFGPIEEPRDVPPE